MHDGLGDGEAKTSAFRSAGDHGVKQMFFKVFRNAGAVVLYIDLGHEFVLGGTDGKQSFHSGSKSKSWVNNVLKRLHRVASDVQNNLHHLLKIDADLGNRRVVVRDQL